MLNQYNPLVWITTLIVILIILYNLPQRSPSPPPPIKPIVPSINYLDTTQLTDYALLDKLLIDKDNIHRQFNGIDRTPKWVSQETPSSSDRPLPHHLGGHTIDDIERLVESQELTYIDQRNKIVSAIALVYTNTPALLPLQLKSVLTQSVTPEIIWIICTAEHFEAASALVETYKSRRIKVITTHQTGPSWLYLASRTTTEYLWILDNNAVPGEHYLERMLKLSATKEYRNALLGTDAGVMHSGLENESNVICLPAKETVSQRVDMVNNVWVLRRSWFNAIFHAGQPLESNLPRALLGHFISHEVHYHAGIPSVALPVDPLDPSVWANQQTPEERATQCEVIDRHLREERDGHVEYGRIAGVAGTAGTGGVGGFVEGFEAPVVAFVVDGNQELQESIPLICSFQRQQEVNGAAVHVVITGKYRGLTAKDVVDSLDAYHPTCSDLRIHDLEVHYGNRGDIPLDEHWRLPNEIMFSLTRLLTRLQPRVLIHIQQRTNIVGESIKAAGKKVHATVISLPARDIGQALWMADLPVSSLEQWHSFTIKIMMVTDRRPHSLSRLIRSAARAHYLGDKIDLTVVMEQTSDRVTQAFVNSLPWPHGRKNIRHRIVKVNRMPVFVEAWYPTNNDEYAILLDEGLEVSSLFYSWAKYSVLRYRYSPDKNAAAAMFGISLYSPRLIETDPSGRRLFAPEATLERFGYPRRSPYLMQSPSNSGALFFPEHWREFHDYITVRLADQAKKQLQKIYVPNARSSQWTNSWRRYFDEMIYLRGYVMLYPNYEDYTSLSTNHLELGSHVTDDYSHATFLYRVPLMSKNIISEQLPSHRLPHWHDLPVLDLWGNREVLDILRERGTAFHRQVSACEPIELGQHRHDPSDMLCPFAQLVTVAVASEDEVVPEFPTRVVTIYVTSTTEPTPPTTGSDSNSNSNSNSNNNSQNDVGNPTIETDETEEIVEANEIIADMEVDSYVDDKSNADANTNTNADTNANANADTDTDTDTDKTGSETYVDPEQQTDGQFEEAEEEIEVEEDPMYNANSGLGAGIVDDETRVMALSENQLKQEQFLQVDPKEALGNLESMAATEEEAEAEAEAKDPTIQDIKEDEGEEAEEAEDLEGEEDGQIEEEESEDPDGQGQGQDGDDGNDQEGVNVDETEQNQERDAFEVEDIDFA